MIKVKFINNLSYQTFPIVGDDYIEITEYELSQIGKTLQYKNGKLITYTPPVDYSGEINELKSWFTNYYTQHEQKYNRLIRMSQLCDDNSNPVDKLNELDALAENKRRRIQEIEGLIGG